MTISNFNMNSAPIQTLTVDSSLIPKRALTRDAVASGMAFLEAELEKRDANVAKPLSSVTYSRDMPVEPGGGFVDFTSSFNVSYGISGPNESGIIGGATNNIPIVQATINKNIFPVFTWANILRIPLIDQKKMQQIGRSLDQILEDGLRLNSQKMLDYNVYLGIPQAGTYGLVNNPNVHAATVSQGSSGQTTWASKTPDEILQDINRAITETWTKSEYDVEGMANHILIDPVNYASIVTRLISQAGSMSILEYVLKNNIGVNQGVNIQIHPSRWCTGAGVGSTNRMVVYRNDRSRLKMDLTVPLGRLLTQPSVGTLSYDSVYAMAFSTVQFRYYQTITYADGI